VRADVATALLAHPGVSDTRAAWRGCLADDTQELQSCLSSPGWASGPVYSSVAEAAAERSRVDDRVVIFVQTNEGFLPMARNWVANTRALGTRLDSYFVAATDAASVAALAAEGVPVVNYTSTALPAGAYEYRTAEYNLIVDHRWAVLAAVLEAGYDGFLVDADAVLQRNPLPYLQTLPADCDGYIAIEIAENEGTKDAVLSRGGYTEGGVSNFMNMGLFLMRAGPRSTAIVSAFRAHLAGTSGDLVDDQTKWNDWFEHNYHIRGLGGASAEARGAAVVDAIMHGTCVGFVATRADQPAGPVAFRWWPLSPALFQNREASDRWHMEDRNLEQAYTFHANFVVGIDAKVDLLRSHGLWALP